MLPSTVRGLRGGGDLTPHHAPKDSTKILLTRARACLADQSIEHSLQHASRVFKILSRPFPSLLCSFSSSSLSTVGNPLLNLQREARPRSESHCNFFSPFLVQYLIGGRVRQSKSVNSVQTSNPVRRANPHVTLNCRLLTFHGRPPFLLPAPTHSDRTSFGQRVRVPISKLRQRRREPRA